MNAARFSIILGLIFFLLVASICSFAGNMARQPSSARSVDGVNGLRDSFLSDTLFVAIDLTYVQLPASGSNAVSEEKSTAMSRGIEPSPWIAWHNPVTFESGAWIMTLDAETGDQKGNRLQIDFTKGMEPVDVLWARHFAASLPGRGVDPVPWIVFTDYKLYTFPITYNSDGTPVAGALQEYSPSINAALYGNAVCMAELPGTEYTDGKARLFIGSDSGYVVVLINTASAGITVEAILPVASAPIVNLQPIPQVTYIALGVVTGRSIKGMHYQPGNITNVFTLNDPRLPNTSDFDTFGPHDVQAPDSATSVRLVIANNTNYLALASIRSNLTGPSALTMTLDGHGTGIRSVVTGSLLMLKADAQSVSFDPDYSPQTGFSGCEVDVTYPSGGDCSFICGDASDNGAVNILDITFLINYLYKTGPAPNHKPAADVNSSGAVNVLDVTYLINFLYKQGPAPNCP